MAPVGAGLTDQAAQQSVLRAIGETKNLIDSMHHQIAAAIFSDGPKRYAKQEITKTIKFVTRLHATHHRPQQHAGNKP